MMTLGQERNKLALTHNRIDDSSSVLKKSPSLSSPAHLLHYSTTIKMWAEIRLGSSFFLGAIPTPLTKLSSQDLKDTTEAFTALLHYYVQPTHCYFCHKASILLRLTNYCSGAKICYSLDVRNFFSIYCTTSRAPMIDGN